MRRIMTFLLAVVIMSCTCCFAAVPGKINIFIEGKQVQTNYPPIYVDNIVFVPARELAEILEYKVDWIESEEAVLFVRMNTEIKVLLESNVVEFNDDTVSISTKPMLIEGTTYIPVDTIGKCFGVFANWDEATRRINIVLPKGYLSSSILPNKLIAEKKIVKPDLLDLTGGFEDGLVGLFEEWPNAELYDDDAYSGERCAKVVGDGEVRVKRLWLEPSRITSGKKYKVSLMIKLIEGEAVTDPYSYGIYLYNGLGGTISSGTGTVQNSNGTVLVRHKLVKDKWVELNMVVDIPAGAAVNSSPSIGLNCAGGKGGASTYLIDDVRLDEVND